MRDEETRAGMETGRGAGVFISLREDEDDAISAVSEKLHDAMNASSD